MWERKNFRDCADELEQVSQIFRDAYLKRDTLEPNEREEAMKKASVNGRNLLDILALNIRRELDDTTFELPDPKPIVGFIKSDKSVSGLEQEQIIKDYQRPIQGSNGYDFLDLRTALDKIAHARRNQAGFHADENSHEVILCGVRGKVPWIAVISILELCKAVRLLPQDIPIERKA